MLQRTAWRDARPSRVHRSACTRQRRKRTVTVLAQQLAGLRSLVTKRKLNRICSNNFEQKALDATSPVVPNMHDCCQGNTGESPVSLGDCAADRQSCARKNDFKRLLHCRSPKAQLEGPSMWWPAFFSTRRAFDCRNRWRFEGVIRQIWDRNLAMTHVCVIRVACNFFMTHTCICVISTEWVKLQLIHRLRTEASHVQG